MTFRRKNLPRSELAEYPEGWEGRGSVDAQTLAHSTASTVFRMEYIEQARRLALFGATHAQMAEFFGVQKCNVDAWMRNIPQFSDAVRDGRLAADTKVAESLYKRACGLTTREIKVFVDEDGNETGRVVTEREHAPEVAAASRWLALRQPALWRETQVIEATVTDTRELSDIERAERIKSLMSTAEQRRLAHDSEDTQH